ncbi:MAG: dihydroneopterin triphosphate diphosphatase [Burkholderiaceae bacterium]
MSQLRPDSGPSPTARVPKIPVSVLVVIHSADLQVLLLERADLPGYWQSVTGSQAVVAEDLAQTACREVEEETGIRVGSTAVGLGDLEDWRQHHAYEIHPRWRHLYAAGVAHNTEHVFGLRIPRDIRIVLSAHEHRQHRWLPWPQAAAACTSHTNAAAIRQLPLRAAMPGV